MSIFAEYGAFKHVKTDLCYHENVPIAKMGFAGIYIIFLISAQKTGCGTR